MIHEGIDVLLGSVFRHPFFDVFFVLVKLFELAGRVKDPEVRCCVRPAAGGPLPAAVVAGQFVIEQLLGEVGLSPSPVDQQVFGQETGCDHAHPVVHVTGLVQFAHAGIHQGITRFAFTPAPELFFVVFPFDVIVFGPE